MTKSNKFFSFALLLSLIASSCTSFSNPSDDPGILNKDGDSQLNLNTPDAETPENEGSSSSYIPSLPKLSLPLSEKQKGGGLALGPVLLAAAMEYYFKPDLASNAADGTLKDILVRAVQAGCVATATSAVIPGSVGKFLFKTGVALPVGVGIITSGMHYADGINKCVAMIPVIKTYLTKTDSASKLVETRIFTVGKVAAVAAGSVIASPLFFKLAKKVGKKIGYIGKSKKTENTEPVNVN